MPSDSEMSGDKVRKRLLELLGTDEVCINDRDFMLRLQEKIEEEHQKLEEQKLKHLQEQEKKRERKLILEGVVERKSKHDNVKKEKNVNEESEYISFEDHSFDTQRPNNNSYRLTEKMKSEMDKESEEKEEGSHCADDEEVKDDPEEEIPEDPSSPAPEIAEDDGNPESQEYHTCSFLNRPYSARMESLIKEETYSGMVEIAEDILH